MASMMATMNIPFEFVDGVVIKDVDELRYHAGKLGCELPTTSTLPLGDLGCMFAYFYLCKKIVDEAVPWVFVMEDDVVFNPSFKSQIRTMPLDDFICSDWTFVHPNHGYSTLGQVITYVGAKKVLNQACDIMSTGLAIDMVLFSDLLKNFHYAICYGTNYWLVDQGTPYNDPHFSERMQFNMNQ
jgi:hypothetical protein